MYYYFSNDKELVATIKIKIVTKGDMSTLTIANATQKMSGVYKVVAKNRHGQVEHKANITVSGILLV